VQVFLLSNKTKGIVVDAAKRIETMLISGKLFR